MKLNYGSPFVDLVNAYIDTVEDDSLTSNQQDQILDDVETWIRQKVEPIPALLDAAPEMLQILENILSDRDGLDRLQAFTINGEFYDPREVISAVIAKAKGGI